MNVVIFEGLNCKCGTERHYQGASYYVSCRRDDGAHALLAGPYPEHHQALDVLDTVKRLADDYDVRAHWYRYGTCAVLAGSRPPGKLNDALAAELARLSTTPCDHGPQPSCPRQDARKRLRKKGVTR